MSKFETFLNLQQSGRLEYVKKQNDFLLASALKQNEQLSKLEAKLNSANKTNRKILKNQLKEIEHREKQNFYKRLAFKNHELLDVIDSVQEIKVKNYLANNYLQILKKTVDKCKKELNEISDKKFCSETLNKIKQIRKNTVKEIDDNPFEELEKKSSKLKEIEKEKEILESQKHKGGKKWRIIVGILLLGSFLTGLFDPETFNGEDTFASIVTLLVLLGGGAYLLYIDIQKRQKAKTESFQKKRKLDELDDGISKQDVENHYQNLLREYPEFQRAINEIEKIENSFKSKIT